MAPRELNTARDVYNPVTQDARGGGNIAHVPVNVEIKLGRETLTLVYVLVGVISFMGLVIGACGIVMGLNLAKQDLLDRDFRDLSTSYKLEERRKIDLETYFEVNGMKVPGDDTHGPTGNLQRMKPKEH